MTDLPKGRLVVAISDDEEHLEINPDGSINVTPQSGTTQTVVGNIASGSADSGNPVKVGGKHNSTLPTLVDGQRGDLQLNTRGSLQVAGDSVAPADGTSNSMAGVPDRNSAVRPSGSLAYTYNGSTWDRRRGNLDATILASAARTATTNSSDQTNYNGRGVHVIIDVTSITDTPSVVPKIQGKCPVSGVYYDILTGVAIVAAGTTVLKVCPGITAAANAAAADLLPRTWRVRLEHADSDSITYSVGASVVL